MKIALLPIALRSVRSIADMPPKRSSLCGVLTQKKLKIMQAPLCVMWLRKNSERSLRRAKGQGACPLRQ